MLQNFDWLEDKLTAFGEDDTLIFDCPGQLELYTHVQVMPRLVRALANNLNMSCVSTFLVDAVSINEPSKFVAGALAGLSAMLQLPVPHITVLSKADLIHSEEELEEFLEQGSASFFVRKRNEEANADAGRTPNPRYQALHEAICSVLDDHAMISYVPFTIKDEESAASVLAFADHLSMYSENAECKIPRELDDATGSARED